MPANGDTEQTSGAPNNQPDPASARAKRCECYYSEDSEKDRQDYRAYKERLRAMWRCFQEHGPKWIEAGCAILLVLITGTYTFLAWHQWQEMQHTNSLTQEALNGSNQALSETLAEMQEQAEEMGRLADNAGKQATQTQKLAGDTHTLAVAAGNQATATSSVADTSSRALIANNRPWLAIESVSTSDVDKPSPGILVTVTTKNVGPSPALNVEFSGN